MSERQTSVKKKPSKADLVCSACGCHMWLWDEFQHCWHGEYHFQDCPTIPGGAELFVRNLEEKARWEAEPVVPREQGARILSTIKLMLDSPGGKGGKPGEIFLQRKQAILDELTKLSAQQNRALSGKVKE